MKISKSINLKLYSGIRLLHILIVILGFLGLFLIFYLPLQFFFVYFYIIVVGLELFFYTRCPLTILEDKLRKKLRKKRNYDFFVNRVLKKNLNFVLPEKLIKVALFGYFLLSVFLLLYRV
jgi:hypothetical protein